MEERTTTRDKKPRPPHLGFATVATLWLWGTLLFFAPTYLRIESKWRVAFLMLGFTALIISFMGALQELSRLWKSEGLNYWSASIVFLFPAFLLHVAVRRYSLIPVLEYTAKIGTLILAAIGGGLFFQGVPYLFWQPTKESTEQAVEKEAAVERAAKGSRTYLEMAASIVVALLSLATAIVRLILEIMP